MHGLSSPGLLPATWHFSYSSYSALYKKKRKSTHLPHLCNEDHMLATELLLQLTHEPHLNLLEGLQLGHRHEDDDCFSATTNLDFLKGYNSFNLRTQSYKKITL